jgi:starch synthase (maltosyl-transferring)
MTALPHLRLIQKQLQLRGKKHTSKKYAVPALWMGMKFKKTPKNIVDVDPHDYFTKAIDNIIRQKPQTFESGSGGSWSRDAVIYNMFIRSSCAFDHNQNGRLDLPANEDGWKETGTFLKAIALLPFIKSLGANTIHLLPITSIGHDGNKGTLGSPYAIKNPYNLDANLGEPNLGLSVEDQCKAFVEDAHHLGMRVVIEFVFRTSAKDGDWMQEHPEWFYWIDAGVQDREPGEHDEAKYGNPHFTEEELRKIHGDVNNQNYDDLLPPHEIYRRMFTAPPAHESIIKANDRWIGRLSDDRRVRIPGAFADWPPNDSQPPWGDVTYLKMYDHPDFNYIAYNTIRMYDRRLARSENINKALWERIAEIIPHYQRTYGIDGVMIDMGHALPMELKHEMVRRARAIDPDFAFWDENFSVNDQSVKEGYNAVIGYQWSDQHHPEKFKNLLRRFAGEGFPLPFFATPESHNTPRATARPGGVRYSKYAWTLSNFLPAIPFIHSGFEVGETFPINTGLDFSKEDLQRYPSEQLPLFSEHAYSWTNKYQFTDWIKLVSSLRQRYHALIVDNSLESFVYLDSDEGDILAFVRTSKRQRPALLIIANANMQESRGFTLTYHTKKRSLIDLLTKKKFAVRNSVIRGKLIAGQVAVCAI